MRTKEQEGICKNLAEYRILETGHGFYKNGVKYFTRNIYIDQSEINEFVKQSGHSGCYCTPYRYPAGEDIDKCLIYGDMYFDLDAEGDFEKARKDAVTITVFLEVAYGLKENEYSICFSGMKGFHITVPSEVIGTEPCRDLNLIYKYMASMGNGYTPGKTVDLQIYDRRRLFRIPNTAHEKSGLYKIQLTIDELKNAPWEKIKTLAQKPRLYRKPSRKLNPEAARRFKKTVSACRQKIVHEEENMKNSRCTLHFIPPCLKKLIDEGAQPGYRNLSIACLASCYKDMGRDYNEALKEITDWNSRNTVPTGQGELERTCRSIWNGNKRYGCGMLSYVSQCSPECRIYSAKQKRAEKSEADTEKEKRQEKLRELGII